jgi:hypothetical protein
MSISGSFSSSFTGIDSVELSFFVFVFYLNMTNLLDTYFVSFLLGGLGSLGCGSLGLGSLSFSWWEPSVSSFITLLTDLRPKDILDTFEIGPTSSMVGGLNNCIGVFT